ncbi:MAG: histidinol-phosphatase [Gammaproteobacteria bacterium]|nr:histidinol-phosphatase [Gammaproteobacteria bacterium]NIR84798.1 histidinol-phosphatase [Gammaproteobacteria bacterium]NIR91512.1 histidinol-phosphatase [Gammaproteobacteria bacterium]NIU05845.1 histidinol-phosphatase [Gammaproteobacteria bacterium]NIV76700.1 histidinol-phosphatase [Gammaproteobacteria bacterium]
MPERCPRELIELAARIADVAGTITRKHYRTAVTVEDKPDASPCTVADREAESAMRGLIAAECPEHGISGEEFGFDRPDADYVWVLDPIDGTRAFICGIPLYTTLVALTLGGRPLLGLIDQPVTGERWVGASGWPTTLNGQAVRTRRCPDPAEAYLCSTTPAMFEGADASAFARVAEQVRSVRYGTDGYAYGLLAGGWVDLVVEADLAPYDYLSHVPVVAGAGGVVTDWQGRNLDLSLGAARIVACGDPVLHARTLELLNAAERPHPE